MAECQKETEDILSDPAVAGLREVGEHFDSRGEQAYICIRPDEDSSVLIGVRASMAETLELLDHERKHEGRYKTTKWIQPSVLAFHRSQYYLFKARRPHWGKPERYGGPLAPPRCKQF